MVKINDRPVPLGPDTVFGLLNLEWARMRVDSDVNAIARRWSATEPAMAGLTNLALLEQAMDGFTDARRDAVLGVLVRRASAVGPDAAVAARVALQLMMPKVARLSRAHARLLPDVQERDQLALCAMYSVIRTFPERITHHVPPHLAWRAHREMQRDVLAQIADWPASLEELPAREHEMNPSEELALLLTWAVAERVISRDDADLLATRYGNDKAAGRAASWKAIGDLQEIARDTGLSPDAIKKRCSRARRRLAAAAASYLAATGSTG